MALYRPIVSRFDNDDATDDPSINLPAPAQLAAISEIERVNLAIKLAELDPWSVSRYFEEFRIVHPASRLAIARVAAARSGLHTSAFIENFDLREEEALAEIGRIALAQSFYSLRHICYWYNLPADVLQREILCPVLSEIAHGSYSHRALRQFGDDLDNLAQDPGALVGLCGKLDVTDARWATLKPKERLLQFARWLQAQYPEFNDEILSWSDETKTEATSAAALALTIGYWHQAEIDGRVNRARASLALFTGYASIPQGSMSSKARNELWSVLLEAHKIFGPQLSTLIPVDFSRTSNALATLTLAAALKGLGGELPQFGAPISSEAQYAEAQNLLLKKLSLEFKRQVGIAEDSEGSNQMIRLTADWGGDISPLLVLAGRYAAHEQWHAQRPVLAEFARRCLDGSFREWRYRQEDQQLDMLTPEQLSAWRDNPAILGIYESDREDPLTAQTVLFEAASQLFSSDILAHVPHNVLFQMGQVCVSPEELAALLVLEEKRFASTATPAQALELIRHSVDSQDVETLRTAVKLVNGAKSRLFKALDEESRSDLCARLSTLNDLVKRITVANINRYCVLSVITDDPKLLLMTGGLMPTGSCVDYRNGGDAGVLMGYVLDGNIKLVLSYVVRTSLLERVSSKWAEGSFRFDPGAQSLTFDRPEGRGCVALGSPVRRQILRLGSLEHTNTVAVGSGLSSSGAANSPQSHNPTKTAVCFQENAYSLSHDINYKIARQQDALISKYLDSCGILLPNRRDTINFPASRNHSGVYSDAEFAKSRSGAVTGPYSISCWMLRSL